MMQFYSERAKCKEDHNDYFKNIIAQNGKLVEKHANTTKNVDEIQRKLGFQFNPLG